MAKGRGAFKSEKRKKELQRQKKQEEKRQRRLHKDASGGSDETVETPEGTSEELPAEETPPADQP